MSEAIEGEVVDPGMVYICPPGKAEAARRRLDQIGQRGGTIRESETCPPGQILRINQDAVEASFAKAHEEFLRSVQTPPRPSVHLDWVYGLPWRMKLPPPPIPWEVA